MLKNKIAVVFNFPEENLAAQKRVINTNGRYFDNSINIQKFSDRRIMLLEKDERRDSFIITPTNITFKSSGKDFEDKIKELQVDYNIVDYKYAKSENVSFTTNMNKYDQDYLNSEYKNKITEYLIWKIESGTSIYKNILNNESMSIMEYIENTDNVRILNFAINHYKVKEKFEVNIENLLFNKEKNPLCHNAIKEYMDKLYIDNEIEQNIDEIEI